MTEVVHRSGDIRLEKAFQAFILKFVSLGVILNQSKGISISISIPIWTNSTE